MTVLARAGLVAAFAAMVGVWPASGATFTVNSTADTWLSGVQQSIRKMEYEVTWQQESLPEMGPAYQAPNRAQNFRTYFTDDGIAVVPRSGEAEWKWGLRFQDAGSRIKPSVMGSRVEYSHGQIAEWFVNDERGLEHGFEISEPVPELQDGTTLRLSLDVEGTLQPRINENGDAIDFVTASGALGIRYDHLAAWDATRRQLPSRMEVAADWKTINLIIDIAGAVYPLTIDPLATTPNWTAESDQAGAFFGYSVAGAGDVDGDGYGDVIVGSHYFDNGHNDEGRAFVFHGSASGLSLTPRWTAESDQLDGRFGYSVAGAGDVNGDGYSDVIVGAIGFNDGEPYEGGAFVYHGSATGLSLTANWTADSDQASAFFGYSVAGAGDVNGDGYGDVIVGALQFANGQDGEGRAFVYHGSALGLTLGASRTLEIDQDSAAFGSSVAGAGDVDGDGFAEVIVGAPNFDNGLEDEGAAFIYHGSAAGLSSTARSTVDSNQAFAELGSSVAGAGDVNGDGYADVIVGAPSFVNGGRAFVFPGSDTGVSATASWYGQGGQSSATYGVSVAGAGDINGDGYADVVVGADFFDDGVQFDEGAAFAYHGSALGLSPTAIWSVQGNQDGAHFGISVAGAGDVNGDGYADVIVGSYGVDNPWTNEGAAFAYRGSAAGLSAIPSWTAESDQADAGLGASVAGAGDVNGDGYADVIVGAPDFDNGLQDRGRALVYHGSPSGLSATPSWTAEVNQDYGSIGQLVAGAGDVNGDGYADVILAGFGVFLAHYGSASGLSVTPSWTLDTASGGTASSLSVSGAGDVNGDGYADIVCSAFYLPFDPFEPSVGSAFVVHGSPSGLAELPNFSEGRENVYLIAAGAGDVNGDGYGDVIIGPLIYHGSAAGLSTASSWSPQSTPFDVHLTVAGAGDVNGDGYADVILGTPGYANGQNNEGAAFVYHGSDLGLSSTASWIAESNVVAADFGVSVAGAGDINGDGYADVIVGASGSDDDDEGRAYVYHGSALSLAVNPDWTILSDQSSAGFGASVAGAGDVNGDGFADVIVGARGFSNGEAGEGGAFVYSGNGMTGRPVVATQLRANDNTVAPWGFTGTSDDFRVRMVNTSSRGRERVKLEVETCPSGANFGNASCRRDVSSSWTDVTATANGTPLTIRIPGLDNETLYRWRARTLYAPFAVAGGTAPPNPSHGPWRRLLGQWTEADIRVMQEVRIRFVTPSSGVAESAGNAIVPVLITTSDGLPTVASASYVFVVYDGTARSGTDYLGGYSYTTYVIAVGTPSGGTQLIEVPIINDSETETDEFFHINLTSASEQGAHLVAPETHSVTIHDSSSPTLSIDDVSLAEGDSGTRLFVFTVTKTGSTSQTVTVDYATADLSASSASDYTADSGTLTFSPTQMSRFITIEVNGDTAVEPDETFAVNLSGSTNASISDSSGVGTILNDDRTNTALQSSQNPSQSGQSVTFTATVTNTGGGTPVGNVVFKDGAIVLGTQALNGSGVAQLSTAALSSGNHAITAHYQGGGGFEPSSSPVLTQTVQGSGNVRTWVATTGADTNPCTRALPCRTFAAAAAVVNAGGEVAVLDSGGYGASTITKSVTLLSPEGIHAAVAPTAGNAITVSAGIADVVVLRGLYLNSQGATHGVVFNSGASLQVENCVISGFSGRGIDFAGAGELFVGDSIIRGNGGIGIRVEPASGAAVALIERTRMESNSSGVAVANAKVDVRRSAAARNVTGFFATQGTLGLDRVSAIGNTTGILTSTNGKVVVSASFVAANTTGISASGAGSQVFVGKTTITANDGGVSSSFGAVATSHGNNRLAGNGVDGAFDNVIPEE